MSRCSALKNDILKLDSVTCQVLYTISVTTCSLTVGMCLADSYEFEPRKTFPQLMCVLYFGMVVSAGLAAFVASLKGLRVVLIVGMVVTIIGSIVIYRSTVESIAMFFGHMLQGMGAGVVFVIVPNYASEMADAEIRDAMSGLHHLYFLFGMYLVHITRSFFDNHLINFVIVVLSVLNFALLFAVDDPPYYRLKSSRKYSDRYPLKIRDYESFNGRLRVYASLENSNSVQTEIGVPLSMILTEKKIWYPLLVNVSMITIQQLTGIVWFTSKLRLKYTIEVPYVISTEIPFTAVVISFQICVTIIALILVLVIEKKWLLCVSDFGIFVSVVLLEILMSIHFEDNLLTIVIFILYIWFQTTGYGPLPWIVMPVICPRNSRLWISGVTVSLYALLNILKNQSIFDEPIFIHANGFLVIIGILVVGKYVFVKI